MPPQNKKDKKNLKSRTKLSLFGWAFFEKRTLFNTEISLAASNSPFLYPSAYIVSRADNNTIKTETENEEEHIYQTFLRTITYLLITGQIKLYRSKHEKHYLGGVFKTSQAGHEVEFINYKKTLDFFVKQFMLVLKQGQKKMKGPYFLDQIIYDLVIAYVPMEKYDGYSEMHKNIIRDAVKRYNWCNTTKKDKGGQKEFHLTDPEKETIRKEQKKLSEIIDYNLSKSLIFGRFSKELRNNITDAINRREHKDDE